MGKKSKTRNGQQRPYFHNENNVYVNSDVKKFYPGSINIENFNSPFSRPMPNNAWEEDEEIIDLDDLNMNTDPDITDVEFEEVYPDEEPAASTTGEDHELRLYLGKLRELATDAYKDKFDDVIEKILGDEKVRTWLLDASRCRNFSQFNKYKVYKLCRMLMNAKVLHFDNGNSLDSALEKSEHNTSYRRTMNKSEDEDLLAEQQVKGLFKPKI